MANPTGYLVTSYGDMITCEPRMSAYAEALRQAITPGCSVIDIGAGSGIFSLLACQFGAGSVIAIEPHDAVELLKAASKTNGFESRIEIFQGISTDYVGPKSDVIISDLRSCLPLFEQHIPSIVDARERLLAPGGRLIPARDRLYTALVHHPEFYLPCTEPWLTNRFGLDLSDGHRFAVNQWRKANFTPIDLMSKPQQLLVIDYATVSDPNISVDFALVPEATGEAHGMLVWFDAELAPGIGFSNAPGEPEQVYGQTFFPFENPVTLLATDRVEINLRANLIEGAYVWSWVSKIWRGGATLPDRTFRQSTFRSRLLSPTKLALQSPNFVPQPSAAVAIDQLSLSLIDGEKSISEIADALIDGYPGRFPNAVDAVNHIAKIVSRHESSDARTKHAAEVK